MGRREIDGRPGIEILEDLRPIHSGTRWAIKLRLTINRGSEDVPLSTDWYLQVDSRYPRGELDIWPARIASLSTTFPHQNANIEPLSPIDEQPWREGRLCVDEADVHLAGERLIGQDTSAKGKMLWHCLRALRWLEAAATGELLQAGDHYEPPHYHTFPDHDSISYCEDSQSLKWWEKRLGQAGDAVLAMAPGRSFFISEVIDEYGDRHRTKWGAAITSSKATPACWVAFPDVLTSRQHHAPHTWGEFREAAHRQGVELDRVLRFVVSRARHFQQKLLLVIGHPIPRVVGGPPTEMHFQALVFPKVKAKTKMTDAAALRRVLESGAIADDERIEWLKSYNLARHHMSVRGELVEPLIESRIAILGCGALGSVVAEILVRMGSVNVALIDRDTFEPPNLPRHTLTLENAGARKVAALKDRLNVANPFANISAVDSTYPNAAAAAAVKEADVIIDCTAEDDVLAIRPEDGRERWCFSFSLGVNADKLFVYGIHSSWFDYDDYCQEFEPFLREVRAALEPLEYRDVGCHNPTFPASFNRILSHAGKGVESLNLALKSGQHKVVEVFTV